MAQHLEVVKEAEELQHAVGLLPRVALLRAGAVKLLEPLHQSLYHMRS